MSSGFNSAAILSAKLLISSPPYNFYRFIVDKNNGYDPSFFDIVNHFNALPRRLTQAALAS
jgi:hypothetical protein